MRRVTIAKSETESEIASENIIEIDVGDKAKAALPSAKCVKT